MSKRTSLRVVYHNYETFGGSRSSRSPNDLYFHDIKAVSLSKTINSVLLVKLKSHNVGVPLDRVKHYEVRKEEK